MQFKVHSLRVENTMTYNDRSCNYEDNKIYVLNCISTDIGINEKYEISLLTIEGDCPSGYCGASWGHATIQRVDSFVGITHKPIKELEFDLNIERPNGQVELNDAYNNIFSIVYDGGDCWYPCGYAGLSSDEKLFEETNRNKEKRPVWIFKGKSALGKSYLAGIIANSGRMKSVYETDEHEKLDKIHEDIIVVGNRYSYSIEEVKNHIEGDCEIILVDFSKCD